MVSVTVVDELISILREGKLIVEGTSSRVCVLYIVKLFLFINYMRMICFIHKDGIMNSF